MALAYTEQQVIKGPKNDRKINGLIYIKTKNNYEPYQQTDTKHHVPGLGQLQTNAAGFSVFIGANLHPT